MSLNDGHVLELNLTRIFCRHQSPMKDCLYQEVWQMSSDGQGHQDHILLGLHLVGPRLIHLQLRKNAIHHIIRSKRENCLEKRNIFLTQHIFPQSFN